MKEGELRQVKATLAESQVELRDKDLELEGTYRSLERAAKERTSLRRQLRGLQEQLQAATGELSGLKIDLGGLKRVLDGVDTPEGATGGVAGSEAEGAEGVGAEPESAEEDFGFMEQLSNLTKDVVNAAKQDEESMQVGRVKYDEGGASRLRQLVSQSEEMLRKSRDFLENAD